MSPTSRSSRLILLALVIACLPAARSASVEPTAPGEARSTVSTEALTAVHLCVPVGVASFANRVHVRCDTPVVDGTDVIEYFAVSAANQAEAARALSIFLSAMVTARSLEVSYTPGDMSGADIFCLASNCRLAWAVEMVQ